MKIIKSPDSMHSDSRRARAAGESIGLVPTMGFFHEGHLSLMKRARKDCDRVVVSLFVNPTQFGPGEDFAAYPRDFRSDCRKAKESGVGVIFCPEPENMYPQGFQTYVQVDEITKGLCGRSRPGHFIGVTTIVSKLFNVVAPDRSYFGKKDYQQFVVIKRMVADLDIPVKIIGCSIVREKDGLAMSSRNTYLKPDQRKAALCLSEALKAGRKMIKNGIKDPAKIVKTMNKIVVDAPPARVDYLEIIDPDNLQPLKRIEKSALLAVAVFVGKTRLIDNQVVSVPQISTGR
jgi:pantoate--beta-alanine ligase